MNDVLLLSMHIHGAEAVVVATPQNLRIFQNHLYIPTLFLGNH